MYRRIKTRFKPFCLVCDELFVFVFVFVLYIYIYIYHSLIKYVLV
jgi:hypothetical protein